MLKHLYILHFVEKGEKMKSNIQQESHQRISNKNTLLKLIPINERTLIITAQGRNKEIARIIIHPFLSSNGYLTGVIKEKKLLTQCEAIRVARLVKNNFEKFSIILKNLYNKYKEDKYKGKGIELSFWKSSTHLVKSFLQQGIRISQVYNETIGFIVGKGDVTNLILNKENYPSDFNLLKYTHEKYLENILQKVFNEKGLKILKSYIDKSNNEKIRYYELLGSLKNGEANYRLI